MTEKHLKIMYSLSAHYKEAMEYFKENQIVGLFLCGSQNYGIDTETSDVDTKLIVLPSFEDLVYNRAAVSHTHVRENEEHIDFKDLRLYFDLFRKQNINFVEILFTQYYILNPKYKELWKQLTDNKELIAHYNPYQTVKCMGGHAKEKYEKFEHMYPSRATIIEEFGYDPKQLCHLLRIEEFLERYIREESYEDCLISMMPKDLIAVKNGFFSYKEACTLREAAMSHVDDMVKNYCLTHKSQTDVRVDELFEKVQYEAMKKFIKEELGNE